MFTLIHKDKDSNARIGKIATEHGTIDTPNFMPVGTGGVVKTLSTDELKKCGVQVVLSNAYHLYLKPGEEIIKQAGGLHKFMNWSGPILTDSGGYQVFSMALLRKIKDDGVEFQSHLDGSRHFLTPESVIEFQVSLGSDIMMPLDECVHFPCEKDYTGIALKRTTDWARRSKKQLEAVGRRSHVVGRLFGIVQGSTYPDLRKQAVEQLLEIGFDGYAIGGVSVGEPRDLMYEVIETTAPIMPQDKARYLMGVGTPPDIFEAVQRGMDIFDCVVPTRNGRNGTAFTKNGRVLIKNARHKADFLPIEEGCSCFACQNYTRGYIHHLFSIDEMLGLRLLSLHNVYFYAKLMSDIRRVIAQDSFVGFKKEFLQEYERSQKCKE